MRIAHAWRLGLRLVVRSLSQYLLSLCFANHIGLFNISTRFYRMKVRDYACLSNAPMGSENSQREVSEAIYIKPAVIITYLSGMK